MIERVTGLDKVAQNLSKFIAETEGITRRQLELIGNDLQSEAQNLAPLDRRFLRSSAYTDARDERTGPVVEVGFTEIYALRMHEDMQYTPSEPGTGPKYLTKPLNMKASTYYNWLLRELRR